MNTEVKPLLEDLKVHMDKCINHLSHELLKIRAGKAMPSMVDEIMVEYYGSPVPLNQVANVTTPDARTIVIQPWEKSMIDPIEKAIMYSNLGFNPQNDGQMVRINVPILTEERRRGLVKNAKSEAEQGKISLRNMRKDANEKIKKMQKDGLAEDEAKDAEVKIQQFTDNYIQKIDALLVEKEKEIMTV